MAVAWLPRIDLIDVTKAYNTAFSPLASLLSEQDSSAYVPARDRLESWTRATLSAALCSEAAHPRRKHRALQDAESLWRVWIACKAAAAERLAGG